MASQNGGKLDVIIAVARAVNLVDKCRRDLQTCLAFDGRKNAAICARHLADALENLQALEEQRDSLDRQLEMQRLVQDAAQQYEIPLGYVGAERVTFVRR
jgi:hypothetical protein